MGPSRFARVSGFSTAGAVETILGREVRARDQGCIGGLGHDACSFDIEVR